MDTLKKISALLFALLLIAASVPAFAFGDDSEWRSDLRRMNDLSNVLIEEDADELNEEACAAVTENLFDFVLITYDEGMREEGSDIAFVTYLYDHNELGYGPSRDGIVMAVNSDTERFVILAFGRGCEIFVDSGISAVASAGQKAYRGGFLKDAFSAMLETAVETVRESYVDYTGDDHYYHSEPIVFGPEELMGSQMPDWYPEDVSSWSFTPISADAKRVVDCADIFTDDEEAALEARIREIAPKYSADIVIFTDTTTHGLGKDIYAADFYDFSGYGYGPEHDGFCLFICMDPSNRGGWCCVTGTRPRELYTFENADALDDVLYAYLGEARYFEGVYDWVGNIGVLLDKGIPFPPEWMPSVNEEFIRTHDENAPRIVDDADVLTAEQLASLEKKAAAIRDKYGVDVIVHIARKTYGMSKAEYADSFYTCNGYGLNDSYDGAMLLMTPFNNNNTEVYAWGAAREKLSERNIELLEDGANDAAILDDYYKAADRWLDYLDTTLRTGRTPRTPFVWTIRSIIASITGLIGGAVSAGKAKRTMKTVRTAYSATDHLVRESCTRTPVCDDFVRSDVTRIYSPRQTDSGRGSGSSGGHSSYSGGYHGSSGTSHSGSGRSF